METTIFGEHFTFLKNTVSTALPKITIPSPSAWRTSASTCQVAVYGTIEELRSDIAAAYAAEVGGPVRARLPVPAVRRHDLRVPQRPGLAGQRDRVVDAPSTSTRSTSTVINESLRDKPDDMAVTLHMCRGNYRSAWFSSGGYDYVAEEVFGGLRVDGLFLEYDDERSGSFEPLRFVPDGQLVVLGVMTTKTPELESKDTLKRRVEEAAKYVDIDRLCISGQCGFASTVEGNALTIDEERAKLDLLVETASEIWG